MTSGAQELVPMMQSALIEQSQYEENDPVSLVQEYSEQYETDLTGYYWSLTEGTGTATNNDFGFTYDDVSGDINSATISFTMPANDVSLDVQGKTTPAFFYSLDGETSTETATVTLGADNNVFPQLVGAELCDSVSYTSTSEDCATIDEYGTITLVGEGETMIVCDGTGYDPMYSSAQAYYTLTVNAAPAP